MAKPDPALLDPARYPFSCRIEPRFGDLDTNMHINNVGLMGMMEEARVRFHRACGYNELHDDIASMVASFAVEFLGQAYYPEALEIHVGMARMGRSSHEVHQIVIQKGGPVAFARTIIVTTRGGRPQEIPAAFRDRIGPWMLRE